ncbi:type IV pilin-like G/H family protein [Argonema antarcticum]|uniref:type IV pilin-like G/H family protein n=1 Tax=Argonema antarcticum TaxID=2942763 RepID=UPI0020113DB1|nr:type IV pilin-like G/H family protein [Argonema antarcticum]MCL1469833.1 type IV pilin-like G/H family protein [Argonema antarcticum A004/B2]
MTRSSNDNDFSQTPQPNRSSNVWIWIAAGTGCGCLGLFVLTIIAAIALPTFLNQANKGRQAEAKQYVSSMLKAQQAYRIEKPTFTNSLPELDLGIQPETMNYIYKIVPQPDKSKSVMVTAQSKITGLKSYTGAVFAIKKGADVTTVTAICESNLSTSRPPAMPAPPKDEKSLVQCPSGSQKL